MSTMKTLTVRSRAEWRRWLEENHATRDEVWVVYFKKHTGRRSIDYEASVEEALCFGWIDGILRRLDEERYARRFTPRRRGSDWSASNRARVERLIESGRMKEAGLKRVEAAKRDGSWQAPNRPDVGSEVPEELREALARNAKARKFFESLPPSERKRYVAWVAVAKRPETRARRVRKSVERLARGEKLGMV
jgi:uncharacterized protein YdeI (YjbR/CyaY-like superfamily)